MTHDITIASRWATGKGFRSSSQGTSLRIEGEHEGVTILAEVTVVEHHDADERRRVKTSRHEEAVVSAKPAANVADLEVTPENLKAKVSKFFGGQDIQLGDAAFDPVFLIRGRAPGVEKVLGPAARAALLEAHEAGVEVCIREGRVGVELAHVDETTLDSAIQFVAKVATALGR